MQSISLKKSKGFFRRRIQLLQLRLRFWTKNNLYAAIEADSIYQGEKIMSYASKPVFNGAVVSVVKEMEIKKFIRKIVIPASLPVIIGLFFVLNIAVIAVIAVTAVGKKATERLPEGIALKSESGLQISFKETRLISPLATAVSISKAAVTSEFYTDTELINLNISDENYLQVIPLNLIRGNFFFIQDTPVENRFAVISDRLSTTLFHSLDAIGNVVNISGTDYVICGIYKADNSLISRISGNGMEDVLFPTGSLKAIKTCQLICCICSRKLNLHRA